MHDRNVASGTAGSRPVAPRRLYYQAADQSSSAYPLSNSGRGLPLDTAFHSPTAEPASRRVSTAGSTLPAYTFQGRAGFSADPFGFPLPASPGFFARRGAISAGRPLSASDSTAFRLTSDCRSPPGLLNPSGSQHATRTHAEQPTITNRPICSRSPPRRNT